MKEVASPRSASKVTVTRCHLQIYMAAIIASKYGNTIVYDAEELNRSEPNE